MKRSVAVEIEETDSSTETEILLEHTARSISDPAIETTPCEAVTPESVARQISAVTDPLTRRLVHLRELMKELRDEQAQRRHEEAASCRAASTFTGSASHSDIICEILPHLGERRRMCNLFCFHLSHQGALRIHL